ncbi:NAD(P)-binding protein [Karstenula rhodostoma CBS 690.94]|uniref:NAD(P)-binding protein n=1 Tax=Karstenula rhodostoma CBS 690.94 TaxID=1392251 RepID=A0A9P4P6V9_9PLEO|nr:NAD(P)-binding protein [Karstenula rhodostoma CBS 690.94]
MAIIVIVGINGRQGTSVAEAFIDAPGIRIRGLTSSPNCPASERWKKMGVEIRDETFDDEEHIKESFAGADVIFALTSYHRLLEDRRLKLAVEVGLRPSAQFAAMRREVFVGRILLDAAAATPRLQRLVMSTLPVTNSGARYASHTAGATYLAKREHINYMRACLPGLAAKTVLVKPCMRMEDYQATLRMSEDGTLSFGTTAPAHVPLHWINMKEDFGIFVRTIILKLPVASLAVAAYSDRVSGENICALISKISGIPCSYRQYTVDEMEGLGKNLASDLLPDPPGSVLYDGNVFTPASINEAMGRYNVSVQQTSFEDYLKAVLPGHIASLKVRNDKEQGAPGPVAPLAKEEGGLLLLVPSSQPDRDPDAQSAVLSDVFMGFHRDAPDRIIAIYFHA